MFVDNNIFCNNTKYKEYFESLDFKKFDYCNLLKNEQDFLNGFMIGFILMSLFIGVVSIIIIWYKTFYKS